MKNFKILNTNEMVKIVGGLLIEHVDYNPKAYTLIEEESDSKEEISVETKK